MIRKILCRFLGGGQHSESGVHASGTRVQNQHFTPRRDLEKRNCQGHNSPRCRGDVSRITKKGLKLCSIISVAHLLDHPAPLWDPVCSFPPALGLPFLGRCSPLSEGSIGVWQRPALPKALKSSPAIFTDFVFVFFCLSWLLEWLRLSEGLRVQETRGPLSLSLIQASISHSMLMSVTCPKTYCHNG